MKNVAYTTRIFFAAAVSMTAMLLLPLIAGAQATGRKAVVLAIPEAFPQTREPSGMTTTIRGMVVRFASPDKPDMIILDRTDASPETLSAAIQLLAQFRRASPTPKHDRVATITGFVPPKLTPESRTKLNRALSVLHATQLSRVGNLGSGRWMELPDEVVVF